VGVSLYDNVLDVDVTLKQSCESVVEILKTLGNHLCRIDILLAVVLGMKQKGFTKTNLLF